MKYNIKVLGFTLPVVTEQMIHIAMEDYRTRIESPTTDEQFTVRFHKFQKRPVCSVYDDQDTLVNRDIVYMKVLEGMNPKKSTEWQ